MNIGDIYWLNPENNIAHPYVIIKIDNDLVTICGITTNQKKLSMPGIIVLEAGEGNLEKESIVETYKTFTVNKKDLKEHIGTLNKERIEHIINIVRL